MRSVWGVLNLPHVQGGNYNHNVGLVNENGGSELKESVTRASGINAFLICRRGEILT